MRSFLSVALALLAATPLLAQARKIHRVQVTNSNGSDVYIDAGRSQGLVQGTVVRLFPPGAPQLQLEVRSLSSTSARLALPSGMPSPPVGTQGEFELAETTPEVTITRDPDKPLPTVPDHPPWQREATQLGEHDPLLSYSTSQHPKDRPMQIDGRIYGFGQWTRDTGGGRDADYLLARVGINGEATNALGLADHIRFAGEFSDRIARVPGRVDEDDQRGRLDLLSVAFGTEEWAPLGIEIGRMRSRHLPEIGLLDGVEGIARFQNGVNFGAGFGALPRPFPARDTGEDVSAHFFADFESGPERSVAGAIGVQKTWHKGTADRDLLILRGEARPSDELWLYANAKIDFYTSGDVRKGSGAELTEMIAQARYDGEKGGTGLMFSHFAWPDLLRREFQVLPDELVRDGRVDRFSLSGWRRIDDKLRVSGRVDHWRDQNDNGTALEASGDWRDLFDVGLSLGATLTWSDGGAQSGPGLRLYARRRFGDFNVRAGYRWYRYELDRLLMPETFTRQSIELGTSWAIGNSDLDVSFERWFGDAEDAYVFGLYSVWRF